MSGYSLAPAAQRDLLDTALYIAEESGNPETGDRIIDQLLHVIGTLAEFQEMGKTAP